MCLLSTRVHYTHPNCSNTPQPKRHNQTECQTLVSICRTLAPFSPWAQHKTPPSLAFPSPCPSLSPSPRPARVGRGSKASTGTLCSAGRKERAAQTELDPCFPCLDHQKLLDLQIQCEEADCDTSNTKETLKEKKKEKCIFRLWFKLMDTVKAI